MIEVVYGRKHRDAGDAWVAQLREQGEYVRAIRAERWTKGHDMGPVDQIYTDDSVPSVRWANPGVPIERIPGVEPERLPEPEPSEEYRLEQRGAWWSVIGPDGKVGRSHRSEDEARAALAALER